MSDQKDVFEIIERMQRRAEEEELAARAPPPARAQPQLQAVELSGETFPCSSCGRFAFNRPTTCYWCQPREPS